VSLAAIGGDTGRHALAWDRARILDGELWRLLTGHLVHANLRHFAVNVLACLALAFLPVAATIGAAAWWRATAVIALAISLGLFVPAWPATYVGASGLLHGLFAFVLVAGRGPSALHGALVAGLWAKVAFEQVFGPLAASDGWLGVRTAVDAHLIGAAVGTVLGTYERRPR
jgi:rhomboid family GlyGly-CTERM serine protease